MNFLIEKAFADTPISNDVAKTAVFAIGGGLIFIWVIVGIIALAGLILWIWALADCLKREFPENEKTTWIVVLILTFFFGFGWLGAIIYLIVGKPKGKCCKPTDKKVVSETKKEEKEKLESKDKHQKK